MSDADALFADLFDAPTPKAQEPQGAGSVDSSSGARTQVQGEQFHGEWYVVIDGVQVGPMGVEEIEDRYGRGEVDANTLAWKIGMPKWLELCDVSELTHLITYSPSATVSEPQKVKAPAASTKPSSSHSGEVAPEIQWKPSAAAALSSLVDVEMTGTQTPPTSQSAREDQTAAPGLGGIALFDGQNQSAPLTTFPAHPMRRASDRAALQQSGMSFGGIAPSMPGPAGLGGQGGYSVIGGIGHAHGQQGQFQLPAPMPGAPGFAPPSPQRHGIELTHVLAGFLILLGLVVVVMLGALIARNTQDSTAAPQAQPQEQSGPPPQQPAVAAPSPGPAPAKEEPKPQVQAAPKAQAPAKAAPAPRPAPKVAAPAKVEKQAPPPKPKEDDIFAAPKPKVRASLSRDDIVSGVNAGKREISHCTERARRGGELPRGSYKIVLDWTIRPNGTVTATKARASGSVKNTSIPACIQLGMRKWKFPESSQGAPIKNFPYTFRVY